MRSLLVADLPENGFFFSFLMGKKERGGVLFCVVSFFLLLIKLNGVKLIAYC